MSRADRVWLRKPLFALHCRTVDVTVDWLPVAAACGQGQVLQVLLDFNPRDRAIRSSNALGICLPRAGYSLNTCSVYNIMLKTFAAAP
eukprot:1148942-Prorocentrum_minimum.AAC.1